MTMLWTDREAGMFFRAGAGRGGPRRPQLQAGGERRARVDESHGEEAGAPVEEIDDLERGGHIGRWRWFVEDEHERVEWSDELYRIYGVPRGAELDLEVVRPLVPETDLDWLRSAARSTGTRSNPLVFWQRVRRQADGAERIVEVRAWAEGDAVVGGTAQDVTQRAQERIENERLHRQRELVLSATADGICGLDRDGRITFLNRAAAAILGRPDEVLLGTRLHDLVHRVRERESHLPTACPFVVGAGDGMARRNRSDYFRRPDGGAFEAEYTMLPVASPDMQGCVVSFRDVTDRVLTDRRLRRTLNEVQALSEQRARLLSEVTLAQEEERARIAAEVHDDTVQVMNAVALQLERVETQPGTTPEVAAELGDLRALVREGSQRLRRLLFDLYPPDLGSGLAEAIARYGEARGADAAFAIDIEVQGGEQLGDDTSTLIYRIAQEALANAAQHARAERVRVSVETGLQGTLLLVEDDGVGFEPDLVHPGEPGHLGLTVMRQRTESAGGQLRLRSAPGRGTQVEAWLPAAGPEEGRERA
jgi:PAS domain S-box-containing protein